MAVSIAIPFYNAEKYLLDAIRSVFAQTYQDWELILLDDGSTDNSLQIAKSINDPRVRVISDGKNKKLATRLNEITNLAKYEFIARMDADDLMFPNRIEKQMACFINNPNLDIVTSGVYSVLNDLSIKGIRGQDYEFPLFDEILSKKKAVVHAALIARKSWYRRHSYDESLSVAQDLDLWLRASKEEDFKIKSISDPLYIYREEDNVTKSKMLRAYANERRMILKYTSFISSPILFATSLFKSFAVNCLSIIGRMDLLQARRSGSETTPKNLEVFENAIAIIKEIKVPGIDCNLSQ